MAKHEVIDAIIEHSIAAFAQRGFDGASLREIALNAGIPLSSIDAYFGSKIKLYETVLKQIWAEIAAERDAAMEAALTASNGGQVKLEEILSAMIAPIAHRAMSNEQSARDRLYLLQHRYREHLALSPEEVTVKLDTRVKPWIDAFANACPALTYEDAVWAFSYCSGVIYSMQLMDRRYEAFLEADVERSPAEVTRDMAAFCRAGVEGMIQLRNTQATSS